MSTNKPLSQGKLVLLGCSILIGSFIVLFLAGSSITASRKSSRSNVHRTVSSSTTVTKDTLEDDAITETTVTKTTITESKSTTSE